MNACANYSCKLYGCVGGCRRVKRKGDDMSIRDWFGAAEQQQRNAFEDTAPGQIAFQQGPRDRPEFEEAMKVLKARAVGMEKELQAQVPAAVRERTDATVSPTSAWAWEWLPVGGGRTRAAEDIVGKQ